MLSFLSRGTNAAAAAATSLKDRKAKRHDATGAQMNLLVDANMYVLHLKDFSALGLCGLTDAPLRPVIHSGSFMGERVPVWDIRDKFGDTNLLVTNMAQGRDLALRLAGNHVSLMRGHGFVAAARSLIEVVRMSVYVPRNARVQMAAMRLGAVKPLSPGEIAARNAGYKPYSPETWRAWEYWATQAGCGELLGKE